MACPVCGKEQGFSVGICSMACVLAELPEDTLARWREEHKQMRNPKMTKMPDKICLTKLDEALAVENAPDIQTHFKGRCAFYEKHLERYRKTLFQAAQAYRDLIPQPVTDEAKAKALKDLTDLWPKGTGFVKDWTEGMFLERHYDTLRAALESPPPATAAQNINQAADALALAAKTFRWYEQMHRAKPDNEKADRNANFALVMESALDALGGGEEKAGAE